MPLDLSAWPGLLLGDRHDIVHRDSLWLGTYEGAKVIVRRLRRSLPTLEWELDLLSFLDGAGVRVSSPILTTDGELHSGGIAVLPWLEGREPESEADWQAVARELRRVHELTAGYPQRPDCWAVTELRQRRRSLDADLDAMPAEVQRQVLAEFEGLGDLEQAVVHGNPTSTAIGIDEDGRVGFYNWDKSRVDVTWLDLANLGVQVLSDEDHLRAQRLSHAWTVANGWIIDSTRAQERLLRLREATGEMGPSMDASS